VVNREVRVDLIEFRRVRIAGGRVVRVVEGGAFSLLVDCVESWLEISTARGEEGRGCEGRIGTDGIGNSLCTIWSCQYEKCIEEGTVTFSNLGINRESKLGHCALQLSALQGRERTKNVLIHRLAVCKFSENIIICIGIHCWCMRQNGIFLERLKSRSLDFARGDALGDQSMLLLERSLRNIFN
jgi:hypothetical protein